MLVAVQKGLVTRMLASLKTAGIVPDEISISTISVFNQVRSTIPPGSNTLVVNSDTGFAEAILIKDGHLMFSRAIPQEGPEKHLEQTVRDIRRVG